MRNFLYLLVAGLLLVGIGCDIGIGEEPIVTPGNITIIEYTPFPLPTPQWPSTVELIGNVTVPLWSSPGNITLIEGNFTVPVWPPFTELEMIGNVTVPMWPGYEPIMSEEFVIPAQTPPGYTIEESIPWTLPETSGDAT